MTKKISLIHSTNLAGEDLEVGDEEKLAPIKGIHKGEKISCVAKIDSAVREKRGQANKRHN